MLSVMEVRHLNCATMRPPLAGSCVCHVLLIETTRGLVLVDTGLGTRDVADPAGRLGVYRRLLRPALDRAETALARIEALGHTAGDVSDIVLTHLDFDHAGGLSDFGHARVHTTAEEHAAAVSDPDLLDRSRYRRAQFAHGPDFRLYAGRGDAWRFDLTAHALEGLDGLALVPMPGHSRGHAAVAVEQADGSVLIHAGDAVFDASCYGASAAGAPLERRRLLRAFEQAVGRDRARIRDNHRALTRLEAEPSVTVVNAHDPRIFARAAAPRL